MKFQKHQVYELIFEQFAKTERNFRQKNVFTSKISLSIRCSAFRIS